MLEALQCYKNVLFSFGELHKACKNKVLTTNNLHGQSCYFSSI